MLTGGTADESTPVPLTRGATSPAIRETMTTIVAGRQGHTFCVEPARPGSSTAHKPRTSTVMSDAGKAEGSKDAKPSSKTSTQLSLFGKYTMSDPAAQDGLARQAAAFFKSQQKAESWCDRMNNAQFDEATKDPTFMSKTYAVRFAVCQHIVDPLFTYKKGASRSRSLVPKKLPAHASDANAPPRAKRPYVKSVDLSCQIDQAHVKRESCVLRLSAMVGTPCRHQLPSTRLLVARQPSFPRGFLRVPAFHWHILFRALH